MKFFPWGRVSAPADVAPEASEEWNTRPRAMSIMFVWLVGCQGLTVFVSAGLGVISAGIGIQLEMQPVLPLDRFKQLTERARWYVRHVGFHRRPAADSFEGMALAGMCEDPPSPSPCEGDQKGTLVLLVQPSVILSARRRGETSHATLARAARHGCFSELLVGSSSERPCPVR